MDTDETHIAVPDAQPIGAEGEPPFRDWKQAFGVTKEQFLDAVNAVGGSADKVRDYLKRRR